jgi:hypothetical protein
MSYIRHKKVLSKINWLELYVALRNIILAYEEKMLQRNQVSFRNPEALASDVKTGYRARLQVDVTAESQRA